MKKTTALIIVDGFGISKKTEGNAVKLAKMPFYNALINKYPNAKLKASSGAVGLKNGQMGNSEVGHLTIGLGRIILQDLTRIDYSVDDDSFFTNPAFIDLFSEIKKKKSALHLMGLVSNGGIHSHINHLFALIKIAKEFGLNQVYIHCFTDGRDTGVNDGIKFVKKIENFTEKIGLGKISTISGRYYAMDREKHWERTKLAYDAIVNGIGKFYSSANVAIKSFYQENVTDEFVVPCVIKKPDESLRLPKEDDGFIFFNFRKDRTKQLTESMIEETFKPFTTNKVFKNFVSMTSYGNYPIKTAFNEREFKNTLSEYISKCGLKQLKIAEPTKFAHVTYFLNGERELPFKNEDRIIVPAKNVRTFDQAPEMSAIEIAKSFKLNIQKGDYDFVMVNLANGDMVGHTGNLNAAIIALETVDRALKIMVSAILKSGGEVIVTADHGNAEEMIKRGKISTTHTTNPVPIILVSKDKRKCKLKNGGLSDIAPTILNLMNLKIPKEMKGKSLIF